MHFQEQGCNKEVHKFYSPANLDVENDERGVEEGKSDLATSRAGAGMKAGGDI